MATLTDNRIDMPAALGADCASRLAREWKVDHTNNVGTVNLSFNWGGLTLTSTLPPTANGYYLLIDADGDGDFSTGNPSVVTGTSLVGTESTFAGVTLPDGAVFTFAIHDAPETLTWNGLVSTSWSDAQNWTPNLVPCAQDKVIIPGGTPNYPVITDARTIAELEMQTGTLTTGITEMLRIEAAGSLAIAAAGSFSGGAVVGQRTRITVVGDATNTNPDGKLTIGGDLAIADGARLFFTSEGIVELAGNMTYGNNPIIYNQGTFVFNGTSAQTITQTAGTIAPRFYNLTVNNAAGVTLSSLNAQIIKVFNVLDIAKGTLTTNNVLMLATENTNPITYGRIATHASGAFIGDVIVEKRLTNLNTGWRQMALPVNGDFGSVVKNNITLLLDNHVTANERNTYWWNPTPSGTGDYATGWTQAGSGDGNNQAFAAFFSSTDGVRVVGNPSATNPDFQNIFSFTGTPNSGYILNSLAFTRDPADASGSNADAKGWNFIANPWPAMVDVDVLLNDATHFTSGYKAVHVWNAVSQQYEAISASGVSINYNTAGPELDRTTVNIPPMQGFWVKASAAGQVANLVESTMRTTEVLSTPAFMKTVPEHFRLNVIGC